MVARQHGPHYDFSEFISCCKIVGKVKPTKAAREDAKLHFNLIVISRSDMWHPKQPASDVVAILGFPIIMSPLPHLAGVRVFSISVPIGSWSYSRLPTGTA